MFKKNSNERTEEQTTTEIDVDSAIDEVFDEFDNIASITVDHLPTYEKPSTIRFTVYTGDADSFEDYIQLFSSDAKVAIENDGETLLASFSVMATYDGPTSWDTAEQTTIYVSDDVRGADPVQLDDGVAYLRDKLENPDQWSEEHRIELDRIRNYSE